MDRQYDSNANIAYISRTKRYIDEDGNEGTQTEIYKKTFSSLASNDKPAKHIPSPDS